MILTEPCHYISSGSDNEPTFEQFVLHQRSIEKNNVVDNNNSESSTVTETISDMCLQRSTGLHFRNEQFE